MARPRLAAAVVAGAATLALLTTTAPALADPPPTPQDEQIQYHSWANYPDWRAGTSDGTYAIPGDRTGVTMAGPAGTRQFTDPHVTDAPATTWEYSTWTSPVHDIGFGATEVVASWNADVPAGTWIQVELRGTYTDGTTTGPKADQSGWTQDGWYVMGRWAKGDTDIKRSTLDGQGDGTSSIWTDTFSIDDAGAGRLLRDYQLRLTLVRAPGQPNSPRVWELGAMASHVPDRFDVAPSAGHIAWGTELAVPRYSQNIHKGQYPEYDNGGEAWCSPTSTEMVVEYWGDKPSTDDLSWVDPSYADPSVDQAARATYDYEYEGAGNWPFNTAYAASYGNLDAVVTRLHSLDDLEYFIAAGIPVVTSQSFLSSELDGAGYGTSGHLMVVIGFTADGDVIANDPASPTDEAVRHVYKRAQFEKVWQRTKRVRANGTIGGGSGGVVYLIKPALKPWPHVPGNDNWPTPW